jgi:CcmD family protein
MSYTRSPQFAFRAGLGAIAIAAVLLAALALPAAAFASEGSGPVPVEPGQHFQIEDNTSGEPDANLPYLFAVFIITWGLFFAYVIYMTLKQRRMQAEIEALAAALQDKAGPPPTP